MTILSRQSLHPEIPFLAVVLERDLDRTESGISTSGPPQFGDLGPAFQLFRI
jgi:hypothetical protein